MLDDYATQPGRMDNEKAQDYLGTLLGKQLRVHTADSRIFLGEFKCTDNVRSQTSLIDFPLTIK